MAKTNGKRNRRAGHEFERKVLRKPILKAIYPNIVSCRSANRKRDSEGIDLTNEKEEEQGRMMDDFSCKSSTTKIDYIKLLAALDKTPNRIPVVLHEYTEKTVRCGKEQFEVQDTYAICYADDYLSLLAYREAFKWLWNHGVNAPEHTLLKLKQLGVLDEQNSTG